MSQRFGPAASAGVCASLADGADPRAAFAAVVIDGSIAWEELIDAASEFSAVREVRGHWEGGGVWKVLKWLFDGDSGSKALDNAHMSLICLLTAHIFTSAKAICWFVGDPNCFHTASSKR